MTTEISDSGINTIATILRFKVGLDTKLYKLSFLQRRVDARMSLLKISSYAEYITLLRRNALESVRLYQSLSINVTRFFRNREVWEFFREKILPKITNQSGPDEVIKIWSAGCASGEETYSIAILFNEWAKNRKFHIFATDRSKKAIETARCAQYKKKQFEEFPPELFQKYLRTTPNDQKYILKESLLRDKITFNEKDINVPPTGNFDVIFCRNVLIYFDDDAERMVFKKFYDALKPEGFLVLGMDETILSSSKENYFTPFSTDFKIYQKSKILN